MKELDQLTGFLESAVRVAQIVSSEVSGVVTTYFKEKIMGLYISTFEPVFIWASQSKAAIPVNYEKLIDQQNVQLIKSQLFSKQVHNAACGNLEAIVSGTESLKKCLKFAGHLMSASMLARCKTHEGVARQVRTYGTSIHGVNIILHKFAGKNPREKSAMARELLDVIFLQIFFVCFCGWVRVLHSSTPCVTFGADIPCGQLFAQVQKIM